eukprot:INCI10926.1.p1 GENE.INCI10926.1~~INCI10926.1.p1  ORF type:complete len:340 (-),score=43.79 INCI10926.1:815-1834(-)
MWCSLLLHSLSRVASTYSTPPRFFTIRRILLFPTVASLFRAKTFLPRNGPGFSIPRVLETLQCRGDLATCGHLTSRQKNISLAVCVDAETNRLPLLYNVSTVGYSASSTYGPDIHENLTQSDLARLAIPEPCFDSPAVCAGGEVQEFDAYIFHPAHVFDIYNEDVADLLGDTAFICADSLANHTSADDYQWVSRYSLQVWSGWGDYAECNRPSPSEEGVCISKEKYLVGREASFGLKPHAGQCADNSDVGVWLSLPEAGMCQNESQVMGPEGSGNCSWRIVKKLKTINGTCLLQQQGMLESCSTETDFPFAKTTAILATAFNSSDPSQGGCPDISPTVA